MTMPRLAIRSVISLAARSTIASNTAIMATGMGLRLLLQIVSFVIVSRFMGAAEFGAFVTVTALVGIVSAFSGWGADQLIVRTVARKPSALPQALGSGLAFLAITAPLLAAAVLLIVPLLVGTSISLGLIAYVVVADIVFAPVNLIGAACYQAVDRPMGTARLNIGFSATRLVAALLWGAIAGKYDARSWGAFYCGASVIYAIVSLLQVRRDLGAPVWNIAWHDWRDGLHFSIQRASFLALANIDKPVVALFSNMATAGIYAAAYRIADGAIVPVNALGYSTYTRFFRLGETGAHESLKLAVRMLPVALGIGLIGSLGIVLVAPLAPRVLGRSYVGTSAIMLILAALPMLYALYYLAVDALAGSGFGGLRALLQCVMPLASIALCALLVPPYGATGAAISCLLSYTIMASAAWLLAIIVSSRTRHTAVSEAEL